MRATLIRLTSCSSFPCALRPHTFPPPPLSSAHPPPSRLFAAARTLRNIAVMGSQPTETEWPASRVRETFIKFFEGKSHVNFRSSPVVPHNDPTLLFANAGMNQFKPIFLGTADPNTELSKLRRACNTQKCIRAGGKHNDLDDVYGLPDDRIYATYFGGDEKLGLPADNEAKDHWLRFLPPSRVLPFGCKDNFWEMGDTGPCGPCTEIHFDRIGGRDAASFVNNDDPTVIEIWNLVFIQFNREADGSLKSLPAKHVDTGMGFERLTSILQNKMSNYDTDIFFPIFDAIQQATGAHPYSGKVGSDDVDNVDMAYRVVADHIRTISFAIADGSRPGNEGREYVLRRILRRAVRYGTEVLKAQQGFFHGLVQVVLEVMGDVFPELKEHALKIREIIADEETSFGRTLTKGYEQALEADGVMVGALEAGAARAAHRFLISFGASEAGVASGCISGEMSKRMSKESERGVGSGIGMHRSAPNASHAVAACGTAITAILFSNLACWFVKIIHAIPAMALPLAPFGNTGANYLILVGVKKNPSELDARKESRMSGIEKFKKAAQEVQGRDAFDLWDTYGFPLDLTQLMADERGLTVDVEGFNIAMDKARERSRKAQNKVMSYLTADISRQSATFKNLIALNQAGGTIGMDADATASLHKRGVAVTDDSVKYTWFQDHASVIKAVYTGSEFLESAGPGEEVGIILETTSFYAEQGALPPYYGGFAMAVAKSMASTEIFDTGIIEGSDGIFEVSNVQIYGGFVLHIGSFSGKTGRLYIGDKVVCKVNYDRRMLIAPNHTCTHILNYALREVLGNHVDQKGSIVLPEKLRFDFSHGKPVKPEELKKIELIVNEQIESKLNVYSKETKLEDAKRINGLRAVFGEVYPDPVRVVAIGRKVEDLLANPDNEEWLSISAELCGGTHISNTMDAKGFVLLSEEGIAKGIRRVTGVTMDCAFKALELAFAIEQEVDEASRAEGSLLEQKVASLNNRVEGASIPASKKADLKAKISVLQSQVIKAKKKMAEEHMRKAIEVAVQTAETASSSGKAYCISLVDVGSDTAAIREAVVKVMEQKGLAMMVISRDEKANKAFVCAGVPEQDVKYKQLKVTEWLKNVLDFINGKGGGGKGGLAQGQGSDIAQVKAAMDAAESFAAMKLH
ncbi:alanine--tRNA ligase [Striga asiatica]|uniref:Alanine--tRNA ligase n=1 Tax=Striga asiatica TaxID=4170 RepID=A0A5A7R291_STRAF|nr:alanine--tRNA ligase [Striga asiatica]